jgi:hypothetical protein
MKDYSGGWTGAPVSGVTPTTIIAAIPNAVFGCQGEQGEELIVRKLNSVSAPVDDSDVYCDNRNPK